MLSLAERKIDFLGQYSMQKRQPLQRS